MKNVLSSYPFKVMITPPPLSRQSIISLTRFLVGFKLQPPYPLSSGSITRLEACQGESYLVPCSFVCVRVCTFVPNVWVFVYPLFVGVYCTRLERVLCLCLHVYLCVFLAAAASLRVLSCVPLDKAIQASPRTSPQSWGPYKMPDCGAETQGITD